MRGVTASGQPRLCRGASWARVTTAITPTPSAAEGVASIFQIRACVFVVTDPVLRATKCNDRRGRLTSPSRHWQHRERRLSATTWKRPDITLNVGMTGSAFVWKRTCRPGDGATKLVTVPEQRGDTTEVRDAWDLACRPAV